MVQSLPLVNGGPFLASIVQTAFFQGNAGQAFPVTYVMAVVLFGFALAVLNGLRWPRRIVVAAAFPFAFTHLYEIPYDLLGRIVWPQYYAWAVWPVVLVLNATWLVLGLSTAIYWKVGRWGAAALALTLVTFVLWWTLFWPGLGASQPPLNPRGSGYILSKVLLGITLALVLWEGSRAHGARRTVPPAAEPARTTETIIPPSTAGTP